jgi:hypothetical protein
MLQMRSLRPPKNDHKRSINDFWHCIIENSEGFAVFLTHDRTITRLSGQNMVVTRSGLCPEHERHRNVNDIWPCIKENARAAWRHWTIIELSAAFLPETACDNIGTMFCKWASIEPQQRLAMNLWKGISCAAILTLNQAIGSQSRRRSFWQDRNRVPQSASTQRQSLLIIHLG